MLVRARSDLSGYDDFCHASRAGQRQDGLEARRKLPKLRASCLATSGFPGAQPGSPRAINAVVFTLARPHVISFDGLKKRSKKFAEEKLGEAKWHDAGYDDAAALWSWDWLRAQARRKD